MRKYKQRDSYSNGHSYRDSARKRRNAIINKAYSRAEKMKRGCQVTGWKCNPEDLDWHHVRPKKFNIGSGFHRSFQSFKAELSKCICIHADIHVLIHNGELELDDLDIIPP